MKSRRALSIIAAAVVTVVIGYFVLQQLTWRDLSALLARADARFLVLGFIAYGGSNVLRALRFRALTGDQIPARLLLRTVLIQNLLNTFLPLRAGEASYLFMVHRTGAVRPGDNVGSLLGARALDFLAAVLIPVLTLPLSKAWSAQGLPLGWLVALPLAGVAVLALVIRRAVTLADFIAARANGSRAWLNKALLTASEVLRSLGKLRGASLLGRVALLTACCWILIYVSGYFTLVGVGLEVPFFDCVFAYCFPVVASMTPFYMLGGFGIFEGTIGFGLSLVGIPLSVAVAAALAAHVADLIFVLLPMPLTLVPRLWSRDGPK